jgi:hypothetical protein
MCSNCLEMRYLVVRYKLWSIIYTTVNLKLHNLKFNYLHKYCWHYKHPSFTLYPFNFHKPLHA